MDDNTIDAEIFIIVLVALSRMTTIKDNNYRCTLNAVIHYLFLCNSAYNFLYFIISRNCESQQNDGRHWCWCATIK